MKKQNDEIYDLLILIRKNIIIFIGPIFISLLIGLIFNYMKYQSTPLSFGYQNNISVKVNNSRLNKFNNDIDLLYPFSLFTLFNISNVFPEEFEKISSKKFLLEDYKSVLIESIYDDLRIYSARSQNVQIKKEEGIIYIEYINFDINDKSVKNNIFNSVDEVLTDEMQVLAENVIDNINQYSDYLKILNELMKRKYEEINLIKNNYKNENSDSEQIFLPLMIDYQVNNMISSEIYKYYKSFPKIVDEILPNLISQYSQSLVDKDYHSTKIIINKGFTWLNVITSLLLFILGGLIVSSLLISIKLTLNKYNT